MSWKWTHVLVTFILLQKNAPNIFNLKGSQIEKNGDPVTVITVSWQKNQKNWPQKVLSESRGR